MIKLGIVMDPITSINFKKDTSLALLLGAQRRGWEVYYMEINDLYIKSGNSYAHTRKIHIQDNKENKYSFFSEQDLKLKDLNVILIRKNPPFNIEYLYATYILEHAENNGTLIINKPKSLRDCNEKLFTIWFPELIPDTLITQNSIDIRNFYKKHNEIILKPLHGMGGFSIFHIKKDDINLSVIIEILTKYEKKFCMVQKFLPEIKEGDKRIFIIDGEPFPYCLARIPAKNESRGNLAAGGYGEVRLLSNNDWKISNIVAPILKKRGLIFVGLDVIGNYLTEINVTSPTCIREIEKGCKISIVNILMEAIEKRLKLK
ncbi:Glutathione synthetase [Serratia symbiotica]|nr:Glutathione synthetase [Serratia symbiotica]